MSDKLEDDVAFWVSMYRSADHRADTWRTLSQENRTMLSEEFKRSERLVDRLYTSILLNAILIVLLVSSIGLNVLLAF